MWKKEQESGGVGWKFAVLLAGRYFLGWRKKKALSWFWAGIVFLAVAYLVYRFILDAMIH